MPPKSLIPLLALFLSLSPANGDNHRVLAGDYAVLTTSSEPARKAEKVAARFGNILLLDDGLGEFINLTPDQTKRIIESLSKRLTSDEWESTRTKALTELFSEEELEALISHFPRFPDKRLPFDRKAWARKMESLDRSLITRKEAVIALEVWHAKEEAAFKAAVEELEELEKLDDLRKEAILRIAKPPHELMIKKVLKAWEDSFKEPETDEVTTLVDRYRDLDLDEVEKAVKGFLTAKTVAEKKKFVRHPDRVGPLMDDHYRKHDYKPEGFQEMNRLKTNFRGDLILTSVTTGDFLIHAISLEHQLKDDQEVFLVDWESWVAYGEKTVAEMKKEKPTDPFLIRARVTLAHYYNYGFSDDQKWQSYQLEVGLEGEGISGYVARDSDLGRKWSEAIDEEPAEPYILKVAYPAEARADNQVKIVEVVEGDGWVLKSPKDEDEGEEKDDE